MMRINVQGSEFNLALLRKQKKQLTENIAHRFVYFPAYMKIRANRLGRNHHLYGFGTGFCCCSWLLSLWLLLLLLSILWHESCETNYGYASRIDCDCDSIRVCEERAKRRKGLISKQWKLFRWKFLPNGINSTRHSKHTHTRTICESEHRAPINCLSE